MILAVCKGEADPGGPVICSASFQSLFRRNGLLKLGPHRDVKMSVENRSYEVPQITVQCLVVSGQLISHLCSLSSALCRQKEISCWASENVGISALIVDAVFQRFEESLGSVRRV
jgi:hypothetical protein